MTYASLFEAEALATLRIDVLAAVGYVTNWQLILDDHSILSRLRSRRCCATYGRSPSRNSSISPGLSSGLQVLTSAQSALLICSLSALLLLRWQ
jgi:hypothetical protein